jgi:PAS domain S-box-containing protein
MSDWINGLNIPFRQLLEQLAHGVIVTSEDDVIRYINHQLATMLGYTPQEMIGQVSYQLLLPPEYWAELQQHTQQRLEGIEAYYELPTLRKDGTLIWTSSRATPLRDTTGQIIGTMALIEDITERKNTQVELQKQEYYLQLALNNMPLVLFAIDSQGIITLSQGKGLENSGFVAGQTVGQSIWDINTDERAIQRAKSALEGEQAMGISQVGGAVYQTFYSPLREADDQVVGAVGLSMNITERFQAEQALQETTSRMLTLIENLRQGILVEDAERRLILINQEFCRLFSIPVDPSDLIGQDCVQMAHAAKSQFLDSEGFIEGLDAAVAARQLITGEELSLADGRTLERDFVPIWLQDKYMGHLWQYRDITEHKNHERVLAQARDEALASAVLKSEFLATMSHEIRTPMNGIIGLTELLLEMSLEPEQEELAQEVLEQSRGFLKILNRILEFTSLEAGKARIYPQEFSLQLLLRELIEQFQRQMPESELELVLNIDATIPDLVWGDSARLRQALTILLENAVKFTKNGTVSLNAECLLEDPQSYIIRFIIQDTGIGISPEYAARLFEPFAQADGSSLRRYGGIGLGLAIARRLATLLGGEIGWESEGETGSTFWFTARLEDVPDLPATQATAHHR